MLIGGREPREIRVVEADPAWPGRFEAERARIATALGPRARRIEHIGSTAVPGLAAKPIVDVVVVVDGALDDPDLGSRLEGAGYVLRVFEPDHRMWRTPARDVHVHVWSDAAEVQRHLLFRDWLRADATARGCYAAAKCELATRQWGDMNDYADAKSPVIREITARAEAWAARTGRPL